MVINFFNQLNRKIYIYEVLRKGLRIKKLYGTNELSVNPFLKLQQIHSIHRISNLWISFNRIE